MYITEGQMIRIMDIKKKIGYYTLQFKVGEKDVYNKEEFEKFLKFLNSRKGSEQIFKYEKK